MPKNILNKINQGEKQYNLKPNDEMILTDYSGVTLDDQRKRVDEMEDMINGRKTKSEKVKDTDVGFNNMGLQ